MTDKNSLIPELKANILECLNLQSMTAQDLDENASLFEDDGLGLDSVDALELVVMLETKYSLTLDDKTQAKEIFKSVSALADYIIANQK